MSLKSVEIYEDAVEYIMKRGRMIGLGLLDKDFKVLNFKSLLIVLDVIIYTMVTIYCCFEFFGDLEKSIFNLVTYGFGIQGASKLRVFWLNREKIIEIEAKVLSFHKSASSESSRKVYEKYAGYCVLGGKLMFLVYIGVALVSVLSPVLVILVSGELALPFGFKFPWFDEHSLTGYTINYLYQLSQAYIVIFGMTTSDGLYAFEMLHVYCVFDDLCVMLDELNEDLKDKNKKKSPEIRNKIVEIIKKHQNLLDYISLIENLFRSNFMIIVYSNIFQIVCSLFALVVSKWIIGAFLFIMVAFETLFICTFGEVLIGKNDKFSAKIYDVDWTELSIADQKLFIFALMKTEEKVQMSFIFGILNFDTFVTIFQKVYSFLMVLVNFVN